MVVMALLELQCAKSSSAWVQKESSNCCSFDPLPHWFTAIKEEKDGEFFGIKIQLKYLLGFINLLPISTL